MDNRSIGKGFIIINSLNKALYKYTALTKDCREQVAPCRLSTVNYGGGSTLKAVTLDIKKDHYLLYIVNKIRYGIISSLSINDQVV